jgi:hypothetical protein
MWNSSIIVKSGTHSAWSRIMANIFVDICLFSVVVEPEYAGDIKLTKHTLRYNKPKNFYLFTIFLHLFTIFLNLSYYNG